MSIFKCKMCGGELDIVEGSAIAKCLYCRTKQTVPKSMDENVQNIFNRANILRLKSEFDKAEALYEKIIQADDTQAEAYWGLILCKYGIEYVDDPATERKIPTCHRASYDSIIADDDYKSAVANADEDQRVIYEEQANEIDRIQKEILALAQREEKYDVFICYKETDVNGNRTQDSVIANDIYYQLTNEGFKVFYAAITLEGKLGSAYEPIIFAALNSAKVMLTIGTKPEYFNAVWVRNEWSRFLKIIQKDRSKLLIPCYRDMDAYELPDEFAHLQAQDMSKIGFINDIVRGIQKVVAKDEPKTTVVKETIVSNSSINVAPLLKRAFMFLEDGDWASADEYCEKVLDQDPECAQAYLGKLMAELKIRKPEGLKSCSEPFDNRPSYQKVMRFADDELKAKVNGYIEFINNRRLDAIYMNAVSMMKTASTISHYEKAISAFEGIRGWKDADSLIVECKNVIKELKIKAEKARAEEMVRAEIARKDGIYNSAVALMNNPVGSANKFSTSNYEDAIIRFQSISGWKDADEKIEFCKQKIIELKKAAEVEHLEQERIRENARKEAERVAKRNKRIAIVAVSILCAFFIFIILFTSVIVPNGKYNDAIELMESGKYEEAITAFNEIYGYKDSVKKVSECNIAILDGKYNDAIALMESGKYVWARSAFKELGSYRDSSNKVLECDTAIKDADYNRAVSLMNSGNFDTAILAFEALDGYKDSKDKIIKCKEKQFVAENGQAAYDKWGYLQSGDTITFGVYEQDNVDSNGKDAIDWIVLEVKDGEALVISKYSIDCKPYNTTKDDVTWETCSLRTWLNDDFINSAFSNEERLTISTVTVSAESNPEYDTEPGNATQDKIFLLSISEVNKYSFGGAKACEPTSYAIANGLYVNTADGNCGWFLRSPGRYQYNAVIARTDGEVNTGGIDVSYIGVAVRPAMWIDLKS